MFEQIYQRSRVIEKHRQAPLRPERERYLRHMLEEGYSHNALTTAAKQAGVARDDGARYQPRMQDLRYTFAVHRLTAWFKHGADMGRMIPALSTYMGQHNLVTAERYLRRTPERFRAQLNKLSPRKGKKRWRDDAALMKFLDGLQNAVD